MAVRGEVLLPVDRRNEEDKVLDSIAIYQPKSEVVKVDDTYSSRLVQRQAEIDAIVAAKDVVEGIQFQERPVVEFQEKRVRVEHPLAPIEKVYTLFADSDMGHFVLYNQDRKLITNEDFDRLVRQDIQTTMNDGIVMHTALQPLKEYCFGAVKFVVDFSRILSKSR